MSTTLLMPNLCHCGKVATVCSNMGVGAPTWLCHEHSPLRDAFPPAKRCPKCGSIFDARSDECPCDKIAKLQAFKDWVHAYLDEKGVPKEFPDGPHTKEGCRIGDRMDYVFHHLLSARTALVI